MSGMRELLGLLISVIALVLASLARRTAHERVRPAQLPHEPPQEEPELTEVEVEAWEPVREALSQLLPGEEAEGGAADYWEDEQEDGWERLGASESPWGAPMETFGKTRRLTRLAEAVIMSEIIRPPRALRRWPSR